jgi:hypothetical protein
MLLVTRVSVLESGMYQKIKVDNVQRGNFLQLFTNRKRIKRFLSCIFIGLPIWFVIGILVSFSPEFAVTMGINSKINAGDAVMFSYLGLAVGDLSSGLLSQWLQSRRKVVLMYILITLLFIIYYLFNPSDSSVVFYGVCFGLGVGTGYWALFVTIAAEQFGTNLRSTVATSVPNFIRGTVVPLVYIFGLLRPSMGIVWGAFTVGVGTIAIALFALKYLAETFARDLNFLETDD